MKKFLFFFCSLTILNAQSVIYSPQITNNTFNWERSEKNYGTIIFNLPSIFYESQKLTSEDGSVLLEKGYPELLKFTKAIQIPNQNVIEAVVSNSKFIDIPNIEINPSKGNVYRNIDIENVPFEFNAIYNENKFWPENQVSLSTPYLIRKSRGQSLQIFPIQYNAVTKTLRVFYHIEIELVESAEIGENSLDKTISQESNEHFINTITTKYAAVEDKGRILVISAPEFVGAVRPYVQWKNQRGIPTEVFATNVVGSTVATIKSFIVNYYSSNPDLKYVLLVGDHSHIPTATDLASTGLYGPSDNYYGYLEGSDHYPDVFVGRFSGESVDDISTQVVRTIEYEKTPLVQNSFAKGICIASAEGPGDDGEMDYQHSRFMRDDLIAANYTEVDEFYDGSQGDDDAPGDPTNFDVMTSMNDGKGVFLYTGHGSSTSCATSGFSSYDVPFLTNVGKLPFMWNVACVNGEFMFGTCFAETLLRQRNASGNPIGAIATMMSTINQSWNPPMEGQDEMVDLLVSATDASSMNTFGALSFNGCMQMNDTYVEAGYEMTDTWTCFGDPNLHVRTKTPLNLSASHSLFLPPVTNASYTISSEENAFVSLTRKIDSFGNLEILGTGTIGSSGSISIPTLASYVEGDTILVTVTKFNRVPYINKVVMTNSAASLEENEINVTVFPNPTAEILNFEFENTLLGNLEIRIIDVNGKVVMTQQLVSNSINIASLSNGLYYIEMINSGESLGRKKFIKM